MINFCIKGHIRRRGAFWKRLSSYIVIVCHACTVLSVLLLLMAESVCTRYVVCSVQHQQVLLDTPNTPGSCVWNEARSRVTIGQDIVLARAHLTSFSKQAGSWLLLVGVGIEQGTIVELKSMSLFVFGCVDLQKLPSDEIKCVGSARRRTGSDTRWSVNTSPRIACRATPSASPTSTKQKYDCQTHYHVLARFALVTSDRTGVTIPFVRQWLFRSYTGAVCCMF